MSGTMQPAKDAAVEPSKSQVATAGKQGVHLTDVHAALSKVLHVFQLLRLLSSLTMHHSYIRSEGYRRR